MNDSKLVYFLCMLSDKEYRSFLLFLKSPYFNKKAELVDFLTVVWNEIVKKQRKLSEEDIHRKLYPKGSYQESRLKKLKFNLMQLLQEFVEIQEFREEGGFRKLYFLKKLNHWSEQKHFGKYYDDAKKELENEVLPISDRYFFHLRLLEEWDLYMDNSPVRKNAIHLQEGLRATENFFLFRMLSYMLRSFNQGLITGKEFDSDWKGPVLDYLAQHSDNQTASVRLLHHLYLLMENPADREAFESLRELLSDLGPALPFAERRNVYTALLNHSIRRLNAGEGAYLQDIFSLYQEADANGSLLNRGKISVWHFKNVVSIGCRLEQFDWVEKFINQHHAAVEGDYQANALNFNRGVLHYCKMEYEKAQSYFYRLLEDYKDVFYGLDGRGLMMRIHYETGDMVGVESLCHSFRMYLDRNRDIPEGRKENYHKYIRFFRRLINLPPRDRDRIEALRLEILGTWDRGTGKDWLLDTLNGLLAADFK